MKTCTLCKQTKLPTEFSKDRSTRDGFRCSCKECEKRKYKKWYNTRGKEVTRRYRQSKEWKEVQRRCNKKRGETARYKRQHNRASKAYVERYPERYRARTKLSNEIRSGRMPKASTLQCAHCPNPAEEYHHDCYGPGYELDVVALCKPCHYAAHSKVYSATQAG